MAGSAAPGDLELLRAFANTADLEAGTDALDTPAALHAWLADHALLAEPAAPAGHGTGAPAPEAAEGGGADADADADVTPPGDPARHLARAARLREGFRALALTNAGRHADLRDLNRLAADHHLVVTVAADGTAGLEPAADAQGTDAALGRLLAIAYAAMADGSWPRLKACANDACRWLFYDRSKNRSKRWCTMDICGDIANSRAYRRRQREAGPANS